MIKQSGGVASVPSNSSHLSTNGASEKVLLQKTTKVRGHNEAGILFLSHSRLWWSTGGKVLLSLGYHEIKSHLVSKQAPGKPPLLKVSKDLDPQAATGFFFEFISVVSEAQAWKDRDEVKDMLSSVLSNIAKKSAQGTSGNKNHADNNSASKPVGSGTRQLVSEKELLQRGSLLSSNVELRTLHEQLVKTGIISDEEFWESRKGTIQNEMCKASAQSKGMPSALVSDVRPDTKTPGTVHYNLTPTIIHQIFVEKPAVERLYKECVPEKMSEKVFWTKYFESMHFHRENKKTISNQPVDEEFSKAVAEEVTDVEPIIMKKKLTNVDSTVDISADVGDKAYPASYGTKIDSSQDPNKLVKSLTLIRRFNRHGALVLGSAYDDSRPTKKQKVETKERRLAEELSLMDLEEDKPEGIVPLNIENSSLYFEGRATSNEVVIKTEKLSPKEQLQNWQRETASWRPNFQRASVPESMALSILQEITREKNRSAMQDNAAGSEAELTSLPDDFKAKLYSFFVQGNELLRHFWASFPVTTVKAYDKASRLIQSISTLYDEIQRYQTSLPLEKRSLAQFLLPIIQTFDKAIEKHSVTKKPG